MNIFSKIVVSLFYFGPMLCAPIQKEDFNKTMRELWNDHAVWTREYTVDAIAELPSASFSAKRLLKNQEDLGNAIKPFYGKKAGDKLIKLLKEHILIAVDLIEAAKKNNTKAIKAIDKKWHDNAREISTFLSDANPHIPFNDMLAMMNEHLKLTGDQAVLRLKRLWRKDISNYDAIRRQLNSMADELAQAVIKQFPEKFKK